METQRQQPSAQPRKRPVKRRRPFWLRMLIAFIVTSVVLTIGIGGTGLYLYHHYGKDLPDPEGIITHRPFETTRIYARDGKTLLYEIFDPEAGQRTVVEFSKFPAVLKNATIAVEDANFYNHPGFDLKSIVRALWLNRSGEIMSGASTITQQLVRQVLLPPEERQEVSLRRKVREAILAYRVSNEFSKDQILRLYLNEIYYGNQAYGAEAAARTYFGISVSDLSLAQAALLAGLPQSPTVLNPIENPAGAKARQRIVLEQMVKVGYITQAQSDEALAETLVVQPATVNIKYPHFSYYVRQLLEEQYGPELVNRGGLRVTTTLDPHWQEQAMRIVHERVSELKERNATNGALIALDRESNQVIAMVGSADYYNPEIDGQVNVALAQRQPGSALKPIVYATSFTKGWAPATIILDVPTKYDLGTGEIYAPRNYDGSFHGPVSIRSALANSYNIPAIKALDYVGIDTFLGVARALGINTLTERARYGLSLALGGGEVTLLDLTNAYSSFANGGRRREPVLILKVENNRGGVLHTHQPEKGTPALGSHSEPIAYLITDILKDNQARAPMFGLDSALHLDDDRPAAVKTGTTDDDRDSWAIGYTTEIVVGAWVGNSDNSPMDRVPGSFGGASIWKSFMQMYHEGQPHEDFKRPPGVIEAEICIPSGMKATKDCPLIGSELFVEGQEPTEEDTWFKRLRVNEAGDCYYVDETQGEERIYVVGGDLPADTQGLQGYEQAPTRRCEPPKPEEIKQSPALITEPASGTSVRLPLYIRGSARNSYTLEVGAGSTPTTWKKISGGLGGISGGLLGIWSAGGEAEGSYTLRLTVIRPEGKVVQTSLVELDLTPPQVAISAPATSATLPSGKPAIIQATVDDKSAVRVEFFVDNVSIGMAPQTPHQISWTPTSPGLHLIEAIASDAAGHQTRSRSITVKVE